MRWLDRLLVGGTDDKIFARPASPGPHVIAVSAAPSPHPCRARVRALPASARNERSHDRRQVGTVTDANHADRCRVDAGLAGEGGIRGKQIAEGLSLEC